MNPPSNKSASEKISTETFEAWIRDRWGSHHAVYYLAQILSGESTVKETIEDLKSLEEKK